MSDPLKQADAASSGEKSDNPEVIFWQKEIDNALKREKKFRKEAEHVVKIYEGDKRAENSFNVLFSNTETLLPACYNQLPRPFVDRRFKDADPLAKLGAQTLERTLAVLEDSGDGEYQPFTKLMEQAVLGALVPGRGSTWFKYDATFDKETEDTPVPPDADKTAQDAKGSATGEDIIPATSEKVKYETVCGEDVDYDEMVLGPGRQWARVPWVGRLHSMTEMDAVASFGSNVAAKLKFASADRMGVDTWKRKGSDEDENNPQGTQNVTHVWEIWNKEKKEVIFYAPSYKSSLLKVVEDPYGLSGFFPCPEPLRFLLKRSKLVPTPLYMLYEEQAKELNRITTRINKILTALKVRGFYDGTMQGLKELLESEDNTLIAANNVAALQQGQNLQNSIWFMPFEVLVSALQALWQGREEIKDTIYEITGMADIMRGEGAASAPATLQNIKNQWGTLRLKRWQRYVQEYVRDCLRIMGELSGKHFSLETFAQMTDLPFALPDEIAQAQKTMAAIQQQMAMMQQQAAQMAPPPGVPGALPPGAPAPGMSAGGPPPQAPPPPQPSPQMQQAAQEAMAVLQKPAWEEVVGLLRNDLQRYYRIDIETNSTIAADSQEDKDNVNEAMTALSQMMQSFLPMVEQGALTMPAVKALLLSAIRKFDFGREVEDAVSSMPDQLPPPPAPPGQPTPEELQAKQAQAQADTQAAQIKLQTDQLKAQQDQQEHGFKLNQMAREDQAAQQQHQFDMAKLAMEMQELQLKGQVSQQEAGADQMRMGLEVQEARRDAAANAIKQDHAVQQAVIATQTAKKKAQQAAKAPRPNGGK